MHVLAHGGAGGSPRGATARQAILDEAAEAGVTAETPIDAVVRAVNVLEESPKFNAGRGGTIQIDSQQRMDAGMMASDGRVGAVCNVPGVVNTVDLARFVLLETPHVLLGPEGASHVADRLEIERDLDLTTERQRDRLDDLDLPDSFEDQLTFVTERFGRPSDDEGAMDTVGAVASDGQHLAAATSTGGRWLALGGRIGDVPQIGGGFYCTDGAAVSTTGSGEDIARVTLAREVAQRIDDGTKPREATIESIASFEGATGGSAGVIAIDGEGSIGTAYNTSAMQTAYATER